MVFNGKEFSKEINLDLKNEVATLGFVPEFSDILVGSDGPSVRYVRMKAKIAEDLGIKFIDGTLNESVTTDEVVNKINELSNRPNMCGIIVQLPLPKHIDFKKVLDAIPLNLDVDGLSSAYDKSFYESDTLDGILIMPTASAVLKIMHAASPIIDNKKIVVVGQGKLVGKPIIHLLKMMGHNVGAIDINTEPDVRKNLLINADIVITGVGKPGVVVGEEVKENLIVIDAGTLEVTGELKGDVDFESVSKKASFITPTPGGVGPVTVSSLMENVVLSAKNKKHE